MKIDIGRFLELFNKLVRQTRTYMKVSRFVRKAGSQKGLSIIDANQQLLLQATTGIHISHAVHHNELIVSMHKNRIEFRRTFSFTKYQLST